MHERKSLTPRLMKVGDRTKVFHSSGYARAQSGANFGAASGETFASRKALDGQRKFVRKYRTAGVMQRPKK